MSLMKKAEKDLQLTNLFDDFLMKDLWNWGPDKNSSTRTTIPSVNIRENGEHYLVEMAAPGLTREDFRVELDANLLTITCEKKNDHEEKEGERYTLKEFSYQSFQRSFRLPIQVVDIDHIEARYENGVLQLVIPKREEARPKPTRRIEIK